MVRLGGVDTLLAIVTKGCEVFFFNPGSDALPKSVHATLVGCN